ncbi:MAG TPA: RDD family protein [Polyangia bacterium]|nr:RDD family protein [Polyangia bacterium]
MTQQNLSSPNQAAPAVGAVNPYAPPRADVDGTALAPYAADVRLAERGTRLGAVLLDGLLVVGAALPGAVVLFAARGSETGIWSGIVLLGLLVIGLYIYQWVLISTRGQSLAKGWLGIKIVKLDGSPVTFGSGVALRMWVPAVLNSIPYVGFIFSLVDPLMIFSADRRCLHDHIAGTKVIVA